MADQDPYKTSQAFIELKIKNMTASGKSPQEKAAFLQSVGIDPSWLSTFEAGSGEKRDRASELASSALGGVGDVLDLPLSLLGLGAAAIGKEGPEWRPSKAIGLRDLQGSLAEERGAGDTGRAIAGQAGGVGAVMGIGAGLSAIPTPATRAIGSALRAAPIGQFMGAVGGGAAESAFESEPGDLKGMLAGAAGALGGAAASSIAAGAGAAARGAVDPLTESGRADLAGRVLAGMSTDSKNALTRANEFLQGREAVKGGAASEIGVPGSNPTLAEVTRDPGLAQFERGARSTNPVGLPGQSDVGISGRFAFADAERNRNNKNWLSGAAPADADKFKPQYLAREMLSAANENAQAVAEKLQAAGQGPIDAAKILRDSLKDARTAADKEVSAAYERAAKAAGGGSATFDTGSILTSVSQAFGGLSVMGALPKLNEATRNVLDHPIPQGRVSFDDISGYRAMITDALRNPTMPSREKAALEKVLKGVEQSFDSIPDGAADSAKAAYATARKLRRDVGDLFDRGPISDATARGADGGVSIANEDLVKQILFKPGETSIEALQALSKAVGGDEKAMGALRGYLRKEVVEFATTDDGRFDPRRYAKWMRIRKPALDAMPDLKPDFEDAGAAWKDAYRTAGEPVGPLVQDQREARAVKLLLNNDPQKVAADLANDGSGSLGPAIRNAIGDDQDALNGVRRALVDHMIETHLKKAGQQATSDGAIIQGMGAGLQDDLRTAMPSLRALFTPEQIRRFIAVQNDMTTQTLPKSNASAVGSNTAEKMSTAAIMSGISLGILDPSLLKTRSGHIDRLVRLLYADPARAIADMAYQGMIDPAYGAALLRRGIARNQEIVLGDGKSGFARRVFDRAVLTPFVTRGAPAAAKATIPGINEQGQPGEAEAQPVP